MANRASVTKGYKRPVSVLVVVYTRAGEVLMLRRRTPAGFWQSVTGSLEWGEMPPRAARRELFEETGLTGAPRDCRLRYRFPIAPPWRARYAPYVRYNREYVFALELANRRPVRLDAHEHVEHRWLPWRAAARLASSWTNRQAVLMLLGGRGKRGRTRVI